MDFTPFDPEKFIREMNNKPDYNTNAGSYYKELARKQELIRLLSKRIWEYDVVLKDKITEIERVLTSYIDILDGKFENFDQSVIDLLKEWIDDGTFADIINEEIFAIKLDSAIYKQTFINVKVLGAKGDNIQDDTPYIQQAIDLASLEGGTVFLPTGKYRITSPLMWKSGVSLKGNGTSAVTGSGILHDGELFSAILNVEGDSKGDDFDNPDVWLLDCHFEDFYIDGAGLTHTTQSADGKGIFILYMKRAYFKNVYIKNTIGTGFGCDFLVDTVFDSCVAENCGRKWSTGGVGQSGFGIGSGALPYETVFVQNCVARNCGNYGFFVETQQPSSGIRSKGAVFSNCTALNNRINFGNKGSGPTQFTNLISEGGTIGIQLTESSYGDRLTDILIRNASNTGLFISADYNGDLQVSKMSIYDCRKNIDVIGGSLVLEKISFTDVLIQGSLYAGMEVKRPMKFVRFKGVQFINNGKSSTSGFRQGLMLSKNVENFEFDGVLYADTQAVKTQVLGLHQEQGCILKNGIITNHDVSGYTLDTGLNIIESQLNDVVLKNNVGYNRVEKGSNTFNPNFNYISISFTKQFPKPPMIQITLDGDTEVFATNITRFGFFARVRESSEVTFNWTAEY